MLSSVTEKGPPATMKFNKRLFESRPDNYHARIFEEHSQIIVEVLLSHKLSVPFINKLYELKFYRAAMKNAVLRIENEEMQANRIVRSVHLLIARGVVPRFILSRFINVVSQPEFFNFFKDPLNILITALRGLLELL